LNPKPYARAPKRYLRNQPALGDFVSAFRVYFRADPFSTNITSIDWTNFPN